MNINLNIKDNTCNGRCSQCAECCGFSLPLTHKEVERIRKAIKDNNITFDIKDFITDDSIHMQCPLLDMKTHKCKLHMIDPALKPEVCKRFICSNSKENLIKNIEYFDNRADVNGTSGIFRPMDLLFFDSPMFLLLFASRELHRDTQEKMIEFLNSSGNEDVADAIKDGIIKLEWGDSNDR